MCPREDDTFRSTRYGGHPPACTCVACCEKRRAGISTGYTRKKSSSGTPVWFWTVIAVVVIAVLLALVF
ncbi:hypothetical protein ABFB09_01655 [Dehalogenimonas sp. THU2]|uniref:hypothetical protein n=1 Tax=Dehalogenimonas sp. THU2 TaxID=3151121 RepID=UPI003218129E